MSLIVTYSQRFQLDIFTASADMICYQIEKDGSDGSDGSDIVRTSSSDLLYQLLTPRILFLCRPSSSGLALTFIFYTDKLRTARGQTGGRRDKTTLWSLWRMMSMKSCHCYYKYCTTPPSSLASSTRQFMKLSSPLWLLSSSYTSYQMWDSLSFRRIELIFQGEVWLVVGRWQAVTVFVQVRIFQQSKWFWRKENIWGYQILLRTSHSQTVTLHLSGPWGRGQNICGIFHQVLDPPPPPPHILSYPFPDWSAIPGWLLINFPAPILLSAKVGHTRPARAEFSVYKCTCSNC